MGYRSEVGLGIANYKKLSKRIKSALEEVFGDPTYIDAEGEECLFTHDGLKWADTPPFEDEQIVKIVAWMRKNPSKFKFVRIGEAPGDEEFDGEWDDSFTLSWSRGLSYDYPGKKKRR